MTSSGSSSSSSWVLLTRAFVWRLWQLVIPIAHTIIVFLLGAAVAFVLADPSDFLARQLGDRRALGIAVLYVMLASVVTTILLLLAVPLATQASNVVLSGPGAVLHDLVDTAPATAGVLMNAMVVLVVSALIVGLRVAGLVGWRLMALYRRDLSDGHAGRASPRAFLSNG